MDKEKSSSCKRARIENSKQDECSMKILRSTLNQFDWQSLCFICGFSKKKGNTVLQRVSPGQDVKTKVLQAAIKKNDLQVQNRLALCGEFDLSSVGAGYHKSPCYNNYVHGKRNKEVLNIETESLPEQASKFNDCDISFYCDLGDNYETLENSNDSISIKENTTNFFYENITKMTLDLLKQRFANNEILPLTEICSIFRRINFEQCKKETILRSTFIKSQILHLASDYNIAFYSEVGLPDLVCLNNIPTHYFVRKIYSLMLENEKKENEINVSKEESTDSQTYTYNNLQQTEKSVLYNAASILRNNISEISQTKYYPTVDEVKLKFSKQFVPFNLQLFISWLISKDAFSRATDIPDHHINNQKRMLTLSECIIFSSDDTKSNRISPFHFGLTLQLHHKFGSKFLIDTLNAYGFCATYDELRRFLTALAKIQISKNNKVYVPPKIINRTTGGALIQEGADNVDIRTETIDGKDTYHAMARVIFQQQDVNVKIKMNPIERQQEKSLEISNIPFLNMLYYNKPPKKPEPPTFLNATNEIQSILQKCHGVLRNSDFAWMLLRSFSRGLLNEDTNSKQVFPNWVAFNMGFSKQKNTVTVVQYAPAIHAKPSDLTTVYTTLKKGQELAKECGQSFYVQTFDQQLYALAQFIKFDIPLEMKNSIVRLGSFHTACTFIACIGKIWSDAGLRDMLVDSGVYAGKTVDSMLEGKQFYRAVRGLILCYEVLTTLLLQNYISWIRKNDKVSDILIDNLITKIQNFQQQYLQGHRNKEEFLNFIELIDTVMTPTLSEFIEMGRKDSPTFQFWIECLQSIQILLDFIRAERDYDWDLHLISHARMSPFFFTCNRPNYSRSGTLYVLDMLMKLPEEVKREFKAGNFAVNFTPGAFKGIFSDMATEMTVIKNTKAADVGISGLTRKPATILRWTLTQNIVGEYASEMHNRNNIKDANSAYDNYVHEGEKESLFHRDEEDALKILNYVSRHMTDPFSLEKYSPNLINISTGSIALPDVSKSLLGAISAGTDKLLEFLKRLEKSNEKSFHDAIKRNDLKTFSEMHKCTIYKVNNKETRKVIKPETVFQRALIVSDNRPNFNLKIMMSVPLTDIPCVLFKPDGSRRTTPKSDLMHLLEKNVLEDIKSDKPSLQKYNCIVIDGMAELQALNANNLVTFNDVGHQIMVKIIRKLHDADEVHLIFDRYDDCGINPKQGERFARYGNGSQTIEIMGSRHIGDFKKILASNENKSNLTNFICKYLQQHLPCSEILINENKKVCVAGGIEPRENAYIISKNYQYADFNLACNHMEADTRIIFHVNELQLRYTDHLQIIVESLDTDVFILLLSHYHYFDSEPFIWFYTGRTDRKIDHRRFIPIHKLYGKLGPQKSLALMVLHAVSGCDTVSSFHYVGKKKAYTGFSKLSDSDFGDLTNIVNLPIQKALDVVTKWLSMIYIPSKPKKKDAFEEENVMSINNLRYKIASTKNIAVDKLPPAEPVLLQHVMRVKWQVNEWSQARFANITSFDPTLYGWILNNNVLCFNYFEGDTAMEILQKFICSCSVKSPCSDEQICTCLSQDLKCCDLCSCSIKCQNVRIRTDDIMESETE